VAVMWTKNASVAMAATWYYASGSTSSILECAFEFVSMYTDNCSPRLKNLKYHSVTAVLHQVIHRLFTCVACRNMAANRDEDFTLYIPGKKNPNMVDEVALYWLNKRWIPLGGVKPPQKKVPANLKLFYVFHVEKDILRGRYVQSVFCGKPEERPCPRRGWKRPLVR
jgi:hypothetical protein